MNRNRFWQVYLRPNGIEIFAFACIFAAALRNIWSISLAMDISGGDESYYLYNGISSSPIGYVHIYSRFYGLLHLFNSDPIKLYYLSFQIVCISSTLLFYLNLRMLRVGIFVSSLATLFLLYSPAYLHRSPATHFSLLIILLSLSFALRRKDLFSFIACLIIGFALAACTRPEVTLSLIIAILVAIFSWYNSRKFNDPKTNRIIIGLVCFMGLLFWLNGNPLGARTEEIVISSSYAQTKAFEDPNIAENPYIDHSTISEKYFPGARGIFEYATTNPPEFWWYLKTNTKSFFANLPYLFLNAYGHVTDPIPLRIIQSLLFALPAIILIVRRQWWPRLRDPILMRLGIIMISVCSPVIIVCVLYRPQPGYQIALVFMIYMLWAYLLDKILTWEKLNRKAKGLVGFVACSITVVASPTIADNWIFRASAPPIPNTSPTTETELPNIEIIRFLQKNITFDEPLKITNTGFYGFSENYGDDLKAFLPNFSEVLPPRDPRDFTRFVADQEINLVVSNPKRDRNTGPQDYITHEFVRERLIQEGFREISMDFHGKRIFLKGIFF